MAKNIDSVTIFGKNVLFSDVETTKEFFEETKLELNDVSSIIGNTVQLPIVFFKGDDRLAVLVTDTRLGLILLKKILSLINS